ncbi:MAG: hypothetical protein RLZZ501_401 [Pseudomonadota bacterium]|jgi:thiazolinyl imide reductase
MIPSPPRRLRVVVCGTTFGRIYLRGLALLPDLFEVVGVIARGSPASRAVARAQGVPLYPDPASLPPSGIDAACVVVRAGVVGGAGTELARALLERGIAVLQEHPVHHDELAACLQAARRGGAAYRLNSFYPDVAPVARFIATARRLLAARAPVYLDATCSVHVLFPLLDILGRALGRLRPWSLSTAGDRGAGPFTSLDGTLAEIPFALRVQNEIAPADPDNHAHLLHRIVLGSTAGTLTLTDTHGLVLWSPRLHVPRDDLGQLAMFAPDPALAQPSTAVIGPAAAAGCDAIFTSLWPEAVARALRRFHAAVVSGTDDPALTQAQLATCRLWQEIGRRLGPPRLIAPPPPQPLALAGIAPRDTIKDGTACPA